MSGTEGRQRSIEVIFGIFFGFPGIDFILPLSFHLSLLRFSSPSPSLSLSPYTISIMLPVWMNCYCNCCLGDNWVGYGHFNFLNIHNIDFTFIPTYNESPVISGSSWSYGQLFKFGSMDASELKWTSNINIV